MHAFRTIWLITASTIYLPSSCPNIFHIFFEISCLLSLIQTIPRERRFIVGLRIREIQLYVYNEDSMKIACIKDIQRLTKIFSFFFLIISFFHSGTFSGISFISFTSEWSVKKMKDFYYLIFILTLISWGEWANC